MARFFDALGRFSVRFRYPIVLLWLAGAVAATQLLPSLASAVDNDNTAFLPADSPSVRAAALAAPFQRADELPVTIVASRPAGPLGPADQAAVDRAVAAVRRVPGVAAAREVGLSADGRAAQIQVLVTSPGFGDAAKPLIERLRAAIGQADPPAGLELHTAGQLAGSVDNNSRSQATGERTQQLSLLFVLVLLLVVFRAVLAPLLTLLPALLAIFGRAAFWPSNVRPGPPRIGVWGRVAARVVRRPALTLAIGVLLFGGLALATFRFEPSGFGGASGAPEGSDSAAGDAALAAHFPRAATNPTRLLLRLDAPAWERPEGLVAAQRQLAADPAFQSVLGPLHPNGTTIAPARLTALHAALGPAQRLPATPPSALRGSGVTPAEYQAYRASAQLVSPDGHTVQWFATLSAGDPSGTPALRATPAVRAALDRAAAAAGAADHGVAGQSAALYDISATSSSDLRRIVPVVVVVIGLLLALVLRSLVAPLYLIVSVVLSYLAALGLAVLVFMDLQGQDGLTFFLPFLMFLFLLALGEDYNILVMTRIREEAHHLPLREAVTRAINATGSTVTSAGLVLAGTFGVLVLSVGNSPGADQFRAVGVGLGVGVLMDTFLVRTLLIPSTAMLLGRANWWPSRLGGPDRPRARPPEPEPEQAVSPS